MIMKILSNDYFSNIPGKKQVFSGGPKSFAGVISKHMKGNGYVWVSVVHRYGETDGVHAEHIIENKKHEWWVVETAETYMQNEFTNPKEYKPLAETGSLLVDTLEEILDREKPDLVFINGLSAFVWALLVAATHKKIPVVVQHAGIMTFEVANYAHRFSRAGLRTMYGIEKDFARKATTNVFLNSYSKKVFEKEVLETKKGAAVIIPLPCEAPKVIPKKKVKATKRVEIGVVARWDKIKNHKAILDLAEYTRTQGAPWRISAVTQIPDTNVQAEFKGAYRKHVRVLPPRSPRALRTFYRSMDIMLLPSNFDVSPHVVLEAAFEGVPTVMSPHVGYATTLRRNGASEFVVDFKNIPKAYNQISALIKKNYPATLVKKFATEHNPARVMHQYEQCFLKVVGGVIKK